MRSSLYPSHDLDCQRQRKKEISALPWQGYEVAQNSTFGEVRYQGDVNSKVAN